MTDSNETGRRPLADVPHALDDIDALLAAIGDRTPAIFLDYDGTLTPIVERPEWAVLSDEDRTVVQTLSQKVPVAVVSGRDRPDVENLVGIQNLTFAGSHGFDIRTADGESLEHAGWDRFGPMLDDTENRLHALLDPIDGAQIERKKFSIACHYRRVSDEDYPRFRTALEKILAAKPDLKEKTGKKVFELQPRIDWDKGKAVDYLLGALKLDDAGHVPMFFGDDVTDEDAFRSLQGRGPCVICADLHDADRTTYASFRVDDVPQVISLLRRLTPA